MKRYANPRGTLLFVLIAAVLMIGVDLLVFYPQVHGVQEAEDLPVVESHEKLYEHSEIVDFESSQPMGPPEPHVIKDEFDDEPKPIKEALGPPEPFGPPVPNKKVEALKAKAGKSVPVNTVEVEQLGRHDGRPGKVVIIIDDMGMDRKNSNRTIELPGPLTLAFLPYAPQLAAITQSAKDHGHELIIHVPMQPTDTKLNMGPLALKDGLSREEFDLMLGRIFDSFQGYVGINNHMGSKLTQEREEMGWVMEALKSRNLFFVDSKTIGNSVASSVADEYGLPHADRDVFLDHEPTPEFVASALRKLEKIAHARGYAIAIGHPKTATIEGLKAWLPHLKEKGLELVPVSDVLTKPLPASAATSSTIPQ